MTREGEEDRATEERRTREKEGRNRQNKKGALQFHSRSHLNQLQHSENSL
jgi:hypothetical protein